MKVRELSNLLNQLPPSFTVLLRVADPDYPDGFRLDHLDEVHVQEECGDVRILLVSLPEDAG